MNIYPVPEYDRRRRAESGTLTFVRRVSGTLRALGWILASPLTMLSIYLRERRIDKTGPSAHAGDRSLDSLEQYVMCVCPLSEFSRLGCPTGELKPDENFLLIQNVTFSISETFPVWNSPGEHKGLRLPDNPDLGYVPEGFITDFASIPPCLRLVAGRPLGPYSRAAVVHDWTYATHFDGSSAGRKDCDRAMLHLMRQDGTRPWRRTLIYVGVRIAGGSAFSEAPRTLAQKDELFADKTFKNRYLHTVFFMLAHLTRAVEKARVLERGTCDQLLDQIKQWAEGARN